MQFPVNNEKFLRTSILKNIYKRLLLMQIWKYHYMFVFTYEQCPENFAFLSQEFSGYLAVKFVNFLKSRLIFNIFYYFWMFVNKLFAYVTYTYLKYQRCFNVKSATCYVHIKKVLVDFQICASVPRNICERLPLNVSTRSTNFHNDENLPKLKKIDLVISIVYYFFAKYFFNDISWTPHLE